MEITDFTMKLLILFIPGILGALLIEIMTIPKNKEWKRYLLYSYLISVISYSFYWIIVKESTFFSTLLISKGELNVYEIIWSSIIALIISTLISIIINKKLFYRLAIKLNLTDKFGNDDVWETTHNITPNKNCVHWVVIRNIESNLIYEGQILLYSDSDTKREITLEFVRIYRDNAGEVKLIEEKDLVYLDLSTVNNLTIEIKELPK